MNALATPPKIAARHRERQAFIYVRQSTLAQVRYHTASAARQYDLSQRAQELGGAPEQIRVLDQDQGHSGASATGRDGFATLIAEVGLGHAGAVLSLEVSRLARSCSDGYRLLEICALTDTLVIDEEGIYDVVFESPYPPTPPSSLTRRASTTPVNTMSGCSWGSRAL